MSEGKNQQGVVSTELPKGSQVLKYEKRGGLWHILDLAVCIWIWHYPFWGLGMYTILYAHYHFSIISGTAAIVIFVVYHLQLAFWRPQLRSGFPWFHYVLYNPILDSFLHYMGATHIREGPPIDPERKILLAMCPHGLLGICRGGPIGTAWPTLYPGVNLRWGSFSAAYYMTGIREFSLLVGAVDAGKKTLIGRCEAGESLALLPGGIQEMLETDGNSKVTKLCLKGRYGFVKLAKEQDLLLVPCYCFGEKFTCNKYILPFWRTLHKMRLAGAMFFGRYGTLLPVNDRPVGWVYGQAIETRGKEIEDIHAEYIQAMFEIFERNKRRFGYDDDESLEILDVNRLKSPKNADKKKH